jgi:anti-sigma regulatory factor (Ser/Thr protein kinase)
MTRVTRHFAVAVEAQAMREARASVAAFARSHGLDERAVADISLAVSEAMFNAMDHGHLEHDRIPLDVSFDGDAVEIAVETGCSPEERRELERQLEQMLPSDPPEFDLERGRGLWIIRSKMDAVRIESCTATTIRLVLVKRR